MSKGTLALLVAAVVVAIQGFPLDSTDQLSEAAKAGNWDEFHRILTQSIQLPWPIPVPDDIKTLKGGPDTQVYGQSVLTYKSVSDVNGRRSEFSTGHKVTNNNGDIAEYDFKP